MKETTLRKGNRITLQIILFFVLLSATSFLVQGINDVLLGKKVKQAKTMTLAEVLTQKNQSGNVIKLSDYAIDMKHRINALPEAGVKEDVHIMVPLRGFGQDDDEPILALFVLHDHDYNCVQNALDAWKDSLINMRRGEEMFVEILGMDDLPGNVPNVVRANDRVAKRVLVFREVNYSGAEFILFFVTGLFAVVCIYLYRRIRRLREQEQLRSI